MREFFRPLRRKLGVLTLLVACGVTAGWLRSTFYEDRFFINLSGKSINRIISSPEGIAFEMMGYPFDIFRPETIDMPGPRWNSRTISHYGPFYVVDLTRDLRWSGFQYREGKTVGGSPIFPVKLLIAPYWSIAIPLTLLSAWVLLRKGRKANHLEVACDSPRRIPSWLLGRR